MAATQDSKNDTFKPEPTTYTVKLDDDNLVSVEATSAEEAIKKAKAKDK